MDTTKDVFDTPWQFPTAPIPQLPEPLPTDDSECNEVDAAGTYLG